MVNPNPTFVNPTSFFNNLKAIIIYLTAPIAHLSVAGGNPAIKIIYPISFIKNPNPEIVNPTVKKPIQTYFF